MNWKTLDETYLGKYVSIFETKAYAVLCKSKGGALGKKVNVCFSLSRSTACFERA